MGPATLVNRDQIEGAADLLNLLPGDGFVATGACWAQVEGDGQPYLYILTPNAETEGQIKANLRLGQTLRKYHQHLADAFRRLDPYAIKLVSPSEEMGQALTLWYQQYDDAIPTIYRGPLPGSSSYVTLYEAYIYPASLFAAPPA